MLRNRRLHELVEIVFAWHGGLEVFKGGVWVAIASDLLPMRPSMRTRRRQIDRKFAMPFEK